MKLDWRNWFHKRRFAQDWERAKQAALSTPLEAYYDVPLPEQMSLDDTPLVALDFESDGLEKNAQLLEAGWTRIIDRAILAFPLSDVLSVRCSLSNDGSRNSGRQMDYVWENYARNMVCLHIARMMV